jgi:hypothetical protein
MKKNTNLFLAVFALALVLSVGLACKSLSSLSSEQNTTKPAGNTETANKPDGTNSANSNKNTTEPKIEKADFTLTSEEYDKEFTKKGAKEADLKKYANKIIAVTGRVSLLSLEKKGTVQPWVTLYAPGIGNGVSCYFDDDNLEQMKKLKMDKIVTVQGLQDDFIVPEVSPTLDHCVVIKAD